MDKDVLVQYEEMRAEIKDLRRRIENDRIELDKLESMAVTDSVTCGKKGRKPIRTVKVTGKPTMLIEHRKAMIRNRIKKTELLEAELLELTNQVEDYIEDIPKSELRILFRLYYIDNMTWYQAAMQMNQMFPKRKIKYTEDSCRMKHNRFLEKVL